MRSPAERRFVRQIGLHHFAYLHAVAEGLDVAESAARYLGTEHGHEARSAHQETVDAMRAIARRRSEPWRLVGLSIKTTGTAQPTLEAFAEGRLEGFSNAEVLELYREAFPTDRKTARSHRLRERQLALLQRLEGVAIVRPQPGDLVDGWFYDRTADKLIAAGISSLGELNARIASGGRWYPTLPAVGKAKAQRIAHHLATLLRAMHRADRPLFALVAPPSPVLPFAAASGSDSSGPLRLLEVLTDTEAVSAWIAAGAGSTASAKAYHRKATCLRLWLQHERQRRLAQMDVADYTTYMAFLQNVPDHWISRERARPGQPGWTPFRGPLSHFAARCRMPATARRW